MDKGEKTGLKGRGKVCSARVTLVRTISYTICVAHDSRVSEEVPVAPATHLYTVPLYLWSSLSSLVSWSIETFTPSGRV